MFDFVWLILPLLGGIALGYALQSKRKVNLDRIVLGAILVLIFALGFGIGSDTALLSSLPSVGLDAVAVAALTMGFSAVFVLILRRAVGLK